MLEDSTLYLYMYYFHEKYTKLLVPLYLYFSLGAPHEFQYGLLKACALILYGEVPLEFVVEFLEFIE